MIDRDRGSSVVNIDVPEDSSVRELLTVVKFVNRMEVTPAGAAIGSKQ